MDLGSSEAEEAKIVRHMRALPSPRLLPAQAPRPVRAEPGRNAVTAYQQCKLGGRLSLTTMLTMLTGTVLEAPARAALQVQPTPSSAAEAAVHQDSGYE